MWTDGQRIERHEVEPDLAAAYPLLSHFVARVSEVNGRIRIELLSPSNQPLTVANGRTAVYWSLKADADVLPQVEGFAA
jgi:hypothetical protein